VGHGLFRFRRTGTIYGVFKTNGRTRWKSLSTDDPARARLLLMDEIKNASQVVWRQAEKCTLRQIIEKYSENPMGLSDGTLTIRKHLLKVFERTWKHGIGNRVSDVKPIMLKSWVAERRQEQFLKASGVNNYIRMLHGLFQIAVEFGAVSESPAKELKLLREGDPDRITPTWSQALSLIRAAKRQSSKDLLAIMLFLGLGQAEIANLQGEHIDFVRGQISIRRQKTQRVFTIPMYPQARPLLERLQSEGRIITGKALFSRANPREALALACNRLRYPPFSPRSFRRAFIIRALEKGIDPRCVAAWQGHKDALLILRVYGNLVQSEHNKQMARRLR
jgi:integrase